MRTTQRRGTRTKPLPAMRRTMIRANPGLEQAKIMVGRSSIPSANTAQSRLSTAFDTGSCATSFWCPKRLHVLYFTLRVGGLIGGLGMFSLFKSKSKTDTMSPKLDIFRAPLAETPKERSTWVNLCLKIDDVSAFQGFLACWMIAEYKKKPTIHKMIFIFDRVFGEVYNYNFYKKINSEFPIDFTVNAAYGNKVKIIASVVHGFAERTTVNNKNRRNRGGTIVLPARLFDDVASILHSGAVDNGVAYWDSVMGYVNNGKIVLGNDSQTLKKALPWVRKEVESAGFSSEDFGL